MTDGKRTLTAVLVVSMLIALAAFSLPVHAATGGTLSDEEIHHLQFIREEEKLAHDVYTVLYEKWGMTIFYNIAASEQRHTDAMGLLLDKYGVEDPYVAGVGNFTDEYIAGLYDWLTGWGLESREDAVLVGAFIEEYDILDIWLAYEETDEALIQKVYVNLYEGSYNHLDGFVYNYERLTGMDYDPQLMSPEEYAYVMSNVDKAPKHPDKDE